MLNAIRRRSGFPLAIKSYCCYVESAPIISSISKDFSRRHLSIATHFWNLYECIQKPKNTLGEIFRSATGQSSSSEKSDEAKDTLGEIFRSATGQPPRSEKSDEAEAGDVRGNAQVIETLRKLENDVMKLSDERMIGTKLQTEKVDDKRVKRRTGSANQKLSALFREKETGKVKSPKQDNYGVENDPDIHRPLSPDLESLAQHLYTKGYFENANFMPKAKFDITAFQTVYSRTFLKHAAVKFGKHEPEIAKWLSASDLKKIAQFGCPSLGMNTVHASKIMRKYFGIDEGKVCGKCPLKESCKLSYKVPQQSPVKNLSLSPVMRVLVIYALGLVPKELTVPEEVSASVSRLMKEILKLSRTVS